MSRIFTQFGLPWEEVWQEDDATPNCEGHETPEAAWQRITDSEFKPINAVRTEDVGDCVFYEIGEYLMCLSYPGNSSISKMV